MDLRHFQLISDFTVNCFIGHETGALMQIKRSYFMWNHISEKLTQKAICHNTLTRVSLNHRDMQVHLNCNMLQTRSATSDPLKQHDSNPLQNDLAISHKCGSSVSFARIGSLSSFVET